MLFNYDIDLVSGRYAVDAKSIMGIFSLDLSKPIKLQAHTEDPEALVKAISKFIVQ
jgi:phosphotransferase system HPr-like phosphotransfer protein